MTLTLPDDPIIHHEIIDFIDRNQIYCPLPIPWDETFKAIWRAEQFRLGKPRLPYREMGLLPPLILAGWVAADRTKKERFLHHINWASEHGYIAMVYRQLTDLSAEDYLTENPLSDRWSPLDASLLRPMVAN